MPWKDQEYKKQYMREYARRPDQIAKRDAWRRAHLQLNQQYQKNWREKDPRNAIIVKSRSGAKGGTTTPHSTASTTRRAMSPATSKSFRGVRTGLSGTAPLPNWKRSCATLALP
jgi:hypothetical protein